MLLVLAEVLIEVNELWGDNVGCVSPLNVGTVCDSDVAIHRRCSLDCCRESVSVARATQEFLVCDYLRWSADVRTDDGQFGLHRLQNGSVERFRPDTRVDEHISIGVGLADGLVGDAPTGHDPLCDVQLGRELS